MIEQHLRKNYQTQIEKKGRYILQNDNEDSKREAKVVLFWLFDKFNRIWFVISFNNSFVKLIFNVVL